MFVALQLCVLAAVATVVADVPDLQTMAADSDLVVHAVATDRFAAPGPQGGVVTWTELQVLQARSAKSHASCGREVLWLAQPGGNLNGIVTYVPGAAAVDVGDELVVFGRAMRSWPGVIIQHTLGAGVFVVAGRPLLERGGDVLAGRTEPKTPTPRRVDSVSTLWGQSGLPSSCNPR